MKSSWGSTRARPRVSCKDFQAQRSLPIPGGPNTVRIPAKRNRIFAIDDVDLVVREALPGHSDTFSARHEEPIGERAPASRLG
jgi:hypothetical protein